MFILIQPGQLALDLDIHITDTDGEDTAVIGALDGDTQDMLGGTLDIGVQDGVTQDIGDHPDTTETTHTATEEEVQQLTMAAETTLQTEAIIQVETTAQTEITPIEALATEATAIQQIEITPTDLTAILITEEVHL